jgi:hypothetical protein
VQKKCEQAVIPALPPRRYGPAKYPWATIKSVGYAEYAPEENTAATRRVAQRGLLLGARQMGIKIETRTITRRSGKKVIGVWLILVGGKADAG